MCESISAGRVLDTGPVGYQNAQVAIVKMPLRHDGKNRLIQVQGVGPFWGARRAICFIKTDKERDYLIPKPITFVKFRITAADWNVSSGYFRSAADRPCVAR
jgi:hypothetical protein